VNFYGHAWIALREARSRSFVLGAMLPDLAGMARSRLEQVRDPEVAAGVSLHHRTDAAFHGAPTFLQLYAEAAAALRERGVARGPARGAAHVGLELLLDGSLSADSSAVDEFAEALEVAGHPDVRAALVWRGDGAERFARLHERLCDGGVPGVYRDTERVAERVAWALGSRPRLALDARGERELAAWLAELRAVVENLTPRLLGEVATRLEENKT
jgi:acyl carrier protein phosphodiesterase